LSIRRSTRTNRSTTITWRRLRPMATSCGSCSPSATFWARTRRGRALRIFAGASSTTGSRHPRCSLSR
jgi:hypothetical protein